MLTLVKEEKLKRRHRQIRKKVFGTVERPRLSVHRSHLNFYAQVIDDESERTLLSAATLSPSFRGKEKGQFGNVASAKKFGAYLAQELKKKKVSKIIFDRGGFSYHGRIQAFADALREGGIEF